MIAKYLRLMALAPRLPFDRAKSRVTFQRECLMLNPILSRFSLLLALLLMVGVSPVMAQGNGNGRGKAKKAEVSVATDEQRPQLQRRDDDWEATGSRPGVPPWWCIGRGNPHNTVEDCGYSGTRTTPNNRDRTYGGYRTYDEAHAAFHRALNEKYSALAAERPLDLRYQLELRAQKSAEHNRWHAEMGRRHE